MAYPPAEHVSTRKTTLGYVRSAVAGELAQLEKLTPQETLGWEHVARIEVYRHVLKLIDEIEQRATLNEMSEAVEK